MDDRNRQSFTWKVNLSSRDRCCLAQGHLWIVEEKRISTGAGFGIGHVQTRGAWLMRYGGSCGRANAS